MICLWVSLIWVCGALRVDLHKKSLPGQNIYGYVTPMKVYNEGEATTISVMVDTGSSESWVVSDECHAFPCLNKHKVPIAHRASTPMSITFSSGSVDSLLQERMISIDEVVIPDAEVNLVTSLRLPIFGKLPWDGLLGLGLTSIEQERDQRRSLIDSIKDNGLLTSIGKSNQFLYHIRENGAQFMLGGIDQSLVISKCIHWAPTIPCDGHWCIELQSLSTEFGKVPLNCTALLDTGSFKTYTRKDVWKAIFGNDSELNQRRDMPEIIDVVFKGEDGEIHLNIMKDDYITRHSASTTFLGEDKLEITFEANDGVSQKFDICVVWGNVIFSKYPVIFDWNGQHPKVGFVY